MDESVQREMESRMDGEFSDVQLHTGAKAQAAAESINARAFTVGNHVAFNRGEYQPDSDQGSPEWMGVNWRKKQGTKQGGQTG
jgi:hypothetical protein